MFELEEFEAACERFTEALREMLSPLEEALDNLAEVFESLCNDLKLWPKRDGVPPKKYGLSLQKKQSFKPSVPYQYIPVTRKHLPYMRRNY